jgi:DNA-binding NtrC family response regulator
MSLRLRSMSTVRGHVVVLVGGMSERMDSYRESLRAGGFGVVTTDDTSDGPRLLAALRPAVCVIDVCSLQDKGWELGEAIRARPSLRQTAIILLADPSGHPRGSLKTRAGRLNGTLLAMPVASDDLVDCVATLIGLRPVRPI